MHLRVLSAGTLSGELSDPEQSSRAYLDKTLQGGAQVPYRCSYAHIPLHNVMSVTSSMVLVHHITSVTPSCDTAIFKGQQRIFAGRKKHRGHQ
jgi:hypothetical protein